MPKDHRAVPVTVRGKPFDSIQDACTHFGRGRRNAQRHLQQYGHLDYFGMKFSRKALKGVSHEFKIGPLTFPSKAVAAEALGVSRRTIDFYGVREATTANLNAAAMRYAMVNGIEVPPPVRWKK